MVRHRNQRSVLADEPVVVYANRFTIQTRTQQWAGKCVSTRPARLPTPPGGS
jgi:hypothetical protein